MAKTVGEEKLTMSAPQAVVVRELLQKSSENRRWWDTLQKDTSQKPEKIFKWRLDFDCTITDLCTMYILNTIR